MSYDIWNVVKFAESWRHDVETIKFSQWSWEYGYAFFRWLSICNGVVQRADACTTKHEDKTVTSN